MGKMTIPEGILEEIRQQLAMLHSTVTTLTEQNKHKDEEIRRLNQVLLNMQRARFGQRSEKSSYILGDNIQQLSIYDQPEAEPAPEPQIEAPPHAEVAQVPVTSHTRRKKRTLEEMCASLPVEENIVDLPQEQKQNNNGQALVCIGREYVATLSGHPE